MRAPSRFVVVAILGMSVLAGWGVVLVLERVTPRWRAATIALLLAGVVAGRMGRAHSDRPLRSAATA